MKNNYDKKKLVKLAKEYLGKLEEYKVEWNGILEKQQLEYDIERKIFLRDMSYHLDDINRLIMAKKAEKYQGKIDDAKQGHYESRRDFKKRVAVLKDVANAFLRYDTDYKEVEECIVTEEMAKNGSVCSLPSGSSDEYFGCLKHFVIDYVSVPKSVFIVRAYRIDIETNAVNVFLKKLSMISEDVIAYDFDPIIDKLFLEPYLEAGREFLFPSKDKEGEDESASSEEE